MKPSLRFWRVLCQVAVACGFVVVPFLNLRDITLLSGNLLSCKLFGVTFADPLAVLQTAAAGVPASSALWGGVLVLAIALALGRVFCAWMCPYGLASELVYSLVRKWRTPKTPPFSPSRALMPKGVVTAAALLVVLLFLPEPLLNQLSMPGWYTRALQHGVFFGALLYGALFFPALLFLEALTATRFWCRWLCPQSVLLSLMTAAPLGLRLRFARKQCDCPASDRPCLAACSLALNPRDVTLARRLECTNCGDCVDACHSRGKALSLSLRK